MRINKISDCVLIAPDRYAIREMKKAKVICVFKTVLNRLIIILMLNSMSKPTKSHGIRALMTLDKLAVKKSDTCATFP